jgi:hypothetical protein
LLRRPLFAVALLVALFGCLPVAADASTASVTLTPFGYFALFVQAGPGEANDVSIVRAPNGFDYLIEDRGAAIAPGSGCTSADANHVICPGDAVQQVFVVLDDGDDRLTTAGLAYPESELPFGQAPVAARGATEATRFWAEPASTTSRATLATICWMEARGTTASRVVRETTR